MVSQALVTVHVTISSSGEGIGGETPAFAKL